jgi:hypothetical protein
VKLDGMLFPKEKAEALDQIAQQNLFLSMFIIIINLQMPILNQNKEEIKLLQIMENLVEQYPMKIIGR